MNVIDRFTLLLLEPGEIFFSDHAAVYRLPEKESNEKEGWEKFYVDSEIKGRLKICSKSLVFDPRVKEIPLIKFPLKNCTLIKQGKPPPPQDPTIYYSEEECTIEVESEISVEILEKNVIKPYKFRRKKYVHYFDLNFKKASDVVPQILQLQRASTLPPNDQNVMIEAIVRSLQKRKSFDASLLVSNPREDPVLALEASRVTPLVTNPGRALVTSLALYYQPFNSLDTENALLRIPIEDIKLITKRRYLLKHVGIELSYEERSFPKYLYLIFKLPNHRDNFHACLSQRQNLHLNNCERNNFVYKWHAGVISNFEYLQYLNSASDRSVNDLTQYPVFPWVVADYTSPSLDLSKEETFRDLSKPVGALNEERLQRLKERSREMPEPKFLYGTHYSTPGFVLFYLVRQQPLHMLCLQNGKFDHPDRMFNSLPDTWTNVTTNASDFKELTPEFYDTGNEGAFLKNRKAINFGTRHNGDPVWDVALPPWAKDAGDLVRKLRSALESPFVSRNLHHWIDLIFGYKQAGEDAVEADNVFYHLCYEGSVDLGSITDLNERISLENQITEFGQIPKQLFKISHPQKSSSLSLYNDPLSRSLLHRGPNENAEEEEEEDSTTSCTPSPPPPPPRLLHLFHRVERVEKMREARLHRGSITSVSFTPSGRSIVSLSKDGGLKAYFVPGLEQAGNLCCGSLALSSCVHLPDTNEVLIGSWDNYLYHFNTKLIQKRDCLQAHSDAISCIDVNERVLITGSFDCLVRVWSTPSSRGVKPPLGGGNINRDSGWSGWKVQMDHMLCQMDHDGPVNCLSLHPTQDKFVSATTDGFVNVWQLMRDVQLLNLKCHDGVVTSVCWCPIGERLVSCGEDGRLVLSDALSGARVSVTHLTGSLNCAIWDGRMALVGRESGRVTWYDVAKSEVVQEWEAHAGPVTALCLSPDGRHFVSGGADRKVVLFGVPDSGGDDNQGNQLS